MKKPRGRPVTPGIVRRLRAPAKFWTTALDYGRGSESHYKFSEGAGFMSSALAHIAPDALAALDRVLTEDEQQLCVFFGNVSMSDFAEVPADIGRAIWTAGNLKPGLRDKLDALTPLETLGLCILVRKVWANRTIGTDSSS